MKSTCPLGTICVYPDIDVSLAAGRLHDECARCEAPRDIKIIDGQGVAVYSWGFLPLTKPTR